MVRVLLCGYDPNAFNLGKAKYTGRGYDIK